ncbi:helix-turn-helix transcriptional regulator [bacterium SCSIO 12741]|nr:helix-turn-helix transcriptional regulator [bacterium SCSIO 12741]
MHTQLTEKETTVLRLIIAGYSTRDIGEKLGIHLNTVSSTKRRIMNKLKVETDIGMLRTALRGGLVKIEEILDNEMAEMVVLESGSEATIYVTEKVGSIKVCIHPGDPT